MATITRTIPPALVPRVTAAFNAKYRGPRDTTTTDLVIVQNAIDAFVRGVVAEYEAALADAAAAAQANTDIVLT